MRELLIIETRDAADHKDPARMTELAIGMASAGVPATILLAENGVFAARPTADDDIDQAIARGVRIAADEFALEERGIDCTSLRAGVSVETVDLVVEHLTGGSCVMWR